MSQAALPAVATVLLLILPSAGTGGLRPAVESVIRARLRTYENAWNVGDMTAVTAQYEPSMSGIVGAEFLDYESYLKLVRELASAAQRPVLRLEIHAVRRLGDSYAVANGRVHTVAKDGSEESSSFTVIYEHTRGRWVLIYSHS